MCRVAFTFTKYCHKCQTGNFDPSEIRKFELKSYWFLWSFWIVEFKDRQCVMSQVKYFPDSTSDATTKAQNTIITAQLLTSYTAVSSISTVTKSIFGRQHGVSVEIITAGTRRWMKPNVQAMRTLAEVTWKESVVLLTGVLFTIHSSQISVPAVVVRNITKLKVESEMAYYLSPKIKWEGKDLNNIYLSTHPTYGHTYMCTVEIYSSAVSVPYFKATVTQLNILEFRLWPCGWMFQRDAQLWR